MKRRTLLATFAIVTIAGPGVADNPAAPKPEKSSEQRALPVAGPKAGPDERTKADKPKPAPEPYPAPEAVTAAMKKAAAFFRSHVAFAGGYAWRWPKDMSIAKGEDRDSPALIMMQPPGTPAVGLAMLHAWQVTGDRLFLQGAKEAAQALIWCQLASGGWDSDFDFDPRVARKYHFRRDIEAGDTERNGRHAASTLDDEKTGSALLFLLELAHTDACKDDAGLKSALRFGLDGLLAAQAPNGGWGQHYDGPADPARPVVKARIPAEWPHTWPGVDYTRFYTLNDGNLLSVMRVLLRAHTLEKDARFLDAARKLGRFLLLAQLPEPQPAWAQQYDDEMIPVWARKFEPPAVSSIESATAIEALLELWLATGEGEWVKPLPSAIAWLEKSRLPGGRWARFYELGTNRPLYCKAQTYEVTFDDSDLPTHYGFKTDERFAKEVEDLKARLAMPRDEWLRKQAPPEAPKKWTSRAKGQAGKVTAALQSADRKTGVWLVQDLIDAGEFVKNLKAMSIYVEAARKGGGTFEALRASAASKPTAEPKPRPKP